MRCDLYQEQFELESSHFWHVSKRALVVDKLRELGGVRVLEVGCGTGLLLQELSREGYDVWGCDRSADALAFCRSRGLDQVFLSDAQEPLPEDLGSFDCILALDLLEHLDDDATALELMGRALHPEGYLIVHVPAHPKLYSYWDAMLGHRRRYCARTLRAALEAAGLSLDWISPTFASLLPVAATFRRLRAGSDPASARSDFRFGRVFNRAALLVHKLERAWLRRGRLPFGLSFLAIARPCSAAHVT